MKKVAILLASYNGTKYIKEQIDSILRQKDVDTAIFVSDDLSEDNTFEYLHNIYADNKRLIHLQSNEKFGGAAKNFYRLMQDVDFSGFDYVSLADQDDIWYEDKLIRAINILEEKQIDGYSSNVLAFWENGEEKILDKAQAQANYDYLFEAAGPGCTYVLKNALAESIKTFLCLKWEEVNKIDLHDWFIYAYSRERGHKWYIDNKPSMRYRQHGSNQVGANSGVAAKIKRLKLVFSSWYRNETMKIIKVLELESKYPFSKYILKKSYINNLLLLKYAFQSRRKFKEKLFLSALFFLGIY